MFLQVCRVGTKIGEHESASRSATDALGLYRMWFVPTAELLDRIGWSTRHDLELALRDEKRRRIAALDEGGE